MTWRYLVIGALKWATRFGGRDNWGGVTKRMGTEGETRLYSGRAAGQ
jgi:hypothetical protein